VAPHDLENDAVGTRRIVGSVDHHTSRFSRKPKLIEILFQISSDSGLGSFHPRLQRRKLDLVHCTVASHTPALLERGQVLSQTRILECAAKTLVELVRIVDRIDLVPQAL
jgi:hypothetical protein